MNIALMKNWLITCLATMLLMVGNVTANTVYVDDKISLLLSQSTHTLYVKKGRFIVKSYKVVHWEVVVVGAKYEKATSALRLENTELQKSGVVIDFICFSA